MFIQVTAVQVRRLSLQEKQQSREERLRGLQDPRTGSVLPQQIFGRLLEDVGDGRGLPKMQENEATFHHIWVRKHLENKEVRSV